MAPKKELDKPTVYDRLIVINPSRGCHMAIPSQDLKTCSKCKKEKPYDDFYKQHLFSARSKRTSVMAECKECTISRSRERKNGEKREEIRVQENAQQRLRRSVVRDETFAAYGGYRCICCGETEPSFMTLDHVDNDGADFRRKIAGKRTDAGFHTYLWLAKNGYPKTVQVLCMNCNFGKRMNNGICPHQVRCNDQSKDVEPSGSKRTAPHIALAVG